MLGPDPVLRSWSWAPEGDWAERRVGPRDEVGALVAATPGRCCLSHASPPEQGAARKPGPTVRLVAGAGVGASSLQEGGLGCGSRPVCGVFRQPGRTSTVPVGSSRASLTLRGHISKAVN